MYLIRFTITGETSLDAIRNIIKGCNADFAMTIDKWGEIRIASDKHTLTFIIAELHAHYTEAFNLESFMKA